LSPGGEGLPSWVMEQFRLRTMTATEFNTYRARLIPAYAAEHVEAGDWDPDQAEALAARQLDDLLPAGPQTAGMLLLVAQAGEDENVGHVWIALDRPRPGAAWIYDIEVSPGHRGRGYGRLLLQAAEEQAGQRGATAIGLHVLGTNAVARKLYESAGYQATSLVMRKPLGGGPDAGSQP
jgi:ribosomal protein S18 acetylase RimI-like enzyme